MKMQTTGMMAVVSLCALAGVAQGQLTLDVDINGFDYEFLRDDGAGGFEQGFSGGDPLNHTGKLEWRTGTSHIADVRINDASQFPFFGTGAFTSSLLSFDGEVLLAGGGVDGGWFEIELASGDRYSAQIVKGVGAIGTQSVSGGFDYTIDGITIKGTFHDQDADNLFGGVNISSWLIGQGGDRLLGSFFNVQLDGPRGLDPAPAFGKADIEVVVVVPLPPAAYAGLGMLAGVMGLSYVLRRR